MSPTPDRIKPPEISDFGYVVETLSRAEAEARLLLGNQKARIIGFVLDDECLHPLVEEPLFVRGRRSERYYVLCGEKFKEHLEAIRLKDSWYITWNVDEAEQRSFYNLGEGGVLCEVEEKLMIVVERDSGGFLSRSFLSNGVVFFQGIGGGTGPSISEKLRGSTLKNNAYCFYRIACALDKASRLV